MSLGQLPEHITSSVSRVARAGIKPYQKPGDVFDVDSLVNGVTDGAGKLAKEAANGIGSTIGNISNFCLGKIKNVFWSSTKKSLTAAGSIPVVPVFL